MLLVVAGVDGFEIGSLATKGFMRDGGRFVSYKYYFLAAQARVVTYFVEPKRG